MKTSILSLCSALLLLGCSNGTKKKKTPEIKETTILEKVAHAHGIADWHNVSALKFTFNVDRDTAHFERSWEWMPKDGKVRAIGAQDTVVYDPKAVDSLLDKTHAGFINDKYWLLAPFQLVWDRPSFTYEHTPNAIAPISTLPMHKLTIVYGKEGGYTPGDAYDLYFKDDYLLREWVFRKGDQKEPNLITTWEKYTDTLGLKIATEHKNEDGSFRLYFTGLKIQR